MSGKKYQVLWADFAKLPRYWVIKNHAHQYYHLFYLLSGDAEFLINGNPFQAKSNDCLLFPPNVSHGVTENHTENGRLFEMKFIVYDQFITSQLHTDGIVLPHDGFVETCIDCISRNWKIRGTQQILNVSSYLDALLLYIAQVHVPTDDVWDSRYVQTSQYDNITRRIISYIDNNYKSHINLDMIAKNFGYNKSYLCDVFKQNTGVTIVKYLQYVRIRMAAECLAYCGLKANSTARYMGFQNVSYFHRLFKKMVGITPRSFRDKFEISVDGSIGEYFATDYIFLRQEKSIGHALAALRRLGDVNKTIDTV